MSMFNQMLESETVFPDWKTINHPGQLDQLREISHQKPVVIFKHSTRCGISAHAKYRLESEWNFSPDELDFYYLDLLAHRPVSNHIAESLKVTHQSPQIILLRQGNAVFNTSHHMISVEVLKKALEGKEQA